MKWLVLIGLLFLSACAAQQATCTEPYIVHDDSCCLDRDANNICDVDEDTTLTADAPTDCSVCPPEFVTQIEEKIVYKYVCANGTITDSATGCEELVRSNAHLFTLNTEQSELVEEFSARPACRGKYKAAELRYVATESSPELVLQTKADPKGLFEDTHTLSGSTDDTKEFFFYIGFCDDPDCPSLTDIQLIPDITYAARFELRSADKTSHTQEILLDAAPDGEYGKKEC